MKILNTITNDVSYTSTKAVVKTIVNLIVTMSLLNRKWRQKERVSR